MVTFLDYFTLIRGFPSLYTYTYVVSSMLSILNTVFMLRTQLFTAVIRVNPIVQKLKLLTALDHELQSKFNWGRI